MDAHLAHSFRHLMSDAQCLFIAQSRRKRHQAAAVDACSDIARTAQAAGNDMRHAANGRIAGGAPEGRVVKIQRVDVDRKHGNTALFAMRHRPVAFQQFLEVRQGIKSGQPIVAHRQGGRLVSAAQRVSRHLGVDAQALSGITVMSREVRDASLGVAYRHHDHFIPEQGAVLAVIAQQHPAGVAAAQCLAEAMAAVLVAIVGLQQAEIASDEFRSRIAGQRLEGGVNINHRLLRILRIDERYPFRRGLDQATVHGLVTRRHDPPPSAPRGVPAERPAMFATVCCHWRSE